MTRPALEAVRVPLQRTSTQQVIRIGCMIRAGSGAGVLKYQIAHGKACVAHTRSCHFDVYMRDGACPFPPGRLKAKPGTT